MRLDRRLFGPDGRLGGCAAGRLASAVGVLRPGSADVHAADRAGHACGLRPVAGIGLSAGAGRGQAALDLVGRLRGSVDRPAVHALLCGFSAAGLCPLLCFGLGVPAWPQIDRSNRAPAAREGAVAGLLVVVAYLPWLPNALRRFQVDASYWQGTLKLDEAIRHIAISFTTGETVLEQRAIPLAWGLAVLAGVCLVALAWTAVRGRRTADGRRQTVDGWSAVGGRRSTVRGRRSSRNLAIPQFCNLQPATCHLVRHLVPAGADHRHPAALVPHAQI